jgi:hypothetical protein
MEGFDPQRVAQTLGMPSRYLPCIAVALGYSLEGKVKSVRFKPEDVFRRNSFGTPFEGIDQL